MSVALTPTQLSFLRSRGHSLEDSVQLGKAGVTEAFLGVLERELKRAELVKVRVGRHVEVDLAQVAEQVKGALVHKVGRMAVFYRPFASPVLKLPK